LAGREAHRAGGKLPWVAIADKPVEVPKMRRSRWLKKFMEKVRRYSRLFLDRALELLAQKGD
jgi:hypothetical protein